MFGEKANKIKESAKSVFGIFDNKNVMDIKDAVDAYLTEQGWEKTITGLSGIDKDPDFWTKPCLIENNKNTFIQIHSAFDSKGVMTMSGIYYNTQINPLGFIRPCQLPLGLYAGEMKPEYMPVKDMSPKDQNGLIDHFIAEAKRWIDMNTYIYERQIYIWVVPEEYADGVNLMKDRLKNK
jgi:hypothetical protein